MKPRAARPAENARESARGGVFRLAPGNSLLLASASPRRRDFLASLGLSFLTRPVKGEPQPRANEAPEAYVARAAADKALICLEESAEDGLLTILGADTCVAHGGKILGKPANHAQALEMLRALNGSECKAISVACLILPNREKIIVSDEARIRFHRWPDEVLAAYAATAEPQDKAGAFAAQGAGSFLIAEISGNLAAVIGLPAQGIVKALLEHKVILPAAS